MTKQRTVLASHLVFDPHAGVDEAYDGPLYIAVTYSMAVPHRRKARDLIRQSAAAEACFYGYCFHADPPRMVFYFKDPVGPLLFVAALRAEMPSSVPLPDGPIARAAVECSHEPPPVRVVQPASATPRRQPTSKGTRTMTTRSNSKGFLVLEAFAASDSKVGITRAAAAEAAGCTVQRVGEILRDNSELVTAVDGETKGLYTILAPAWKAFNKSRAEAEAAKAAEAAAKAEAAAAAKQAKADEKAAAAAATPEG